MKTFNKGFTLIELMVVIAIVAILLTLSYPSYSRYVRKADRAEAQVTLLDWANRQEVWRADHPGYSLDINPADTALYAYSMTATISSFTLTATALGSQASDMESGVGCSTLSLDQAGIRGPAGHKQCWGK